MQAGTTLFASASATLRQVEYVPMAMFGSVMGLTGLAVAWRTAHQHYGAPSWISEAVVVLAVASFLMLGVAYCGKWFLAPEAVRAEFQHPIAGNTFATFWVSLLLLPIVLAPFSMWLARAMWSIGALGICALAWHIVRGWLTSSRELASASPAWMLPVVGLLDMPLAVPYLGWPPLQSTMVVGLAVGLFFAVPLFTIIFFRLVFGPPLPQALEPSLLILVAPLQWACRPTSRPAVASTCSQPRSSCWRCSC